MINLIAPGNHGPHLALVCKLLKIQCHLVARQFTWDGEYQKTYDHLVGILHEHARDVHDVALWRWYLETQTVYVTEPIGCNVLIVNDEPSLNKTVLKLLEHLDLYDEIKHLQFWLKSVPQTDAIIRDTWKLILNETPSRAEVDFWTEVCGRNMRIDIFSWLMCVYFGAKGRKKRVHLEFAELFRDAKYSVRLTAPMCAVVLCGYSRTFDRYIESNKSFVDNWLVDVFIHTWDKKGPRSYTGETANVFDPVDAELLNQTYNPRSILIESATKYTNSLLDNFSMIFLNIHQQKDDATVYENADLCSLYKASLMVREFEALKGITYSGMIKIPFIYDIVDFDYVDITSKIAQDVLWVPGEGCKSCKREYNWPYRYQQKAHAEHRYDPDVYWMFGNRTIMMYVCELYIHAFGIASNSLDNNMEEYALVAKHKKFREFVYIFGKEFVNSNNRVSGYYKSNLIREHMKHVFILGCKTIMGKFAQFDIDRGCVGW